MISLKVCAASLFFPFESEFYLQRRVIRRNSRILSGIHTLRASLRELFTPYRIAETLGDFKLLQTLTRQRLCLERLPVHLIEVGSEEFKRISSRREDELQLRTSTSNFE